MTALNCLHNDAKMIGALVPCDGTIELRFPGVRVARVSQPNNEPVHYVQRASLCIVAQGAKVVMIGGDAYDYEAGQIALYSIDVPMAGRVTRASVSKPYLLLMETKNICVALGGHRIPRIGA